MACLIAEYNMPEPFSYAQLHTQIENSGRIYEINKIDAAYLLAEWAHAGQERHSGEPFIAHPLAVAAYLLDLGMETEVLCAGLLHDVVEDTPVPLEEIARRFGGEIALLVDGVTKLGHIVFSSKEEEQAENLSKVLRATAKDVRVMLIKLCDRLHNMRTAMACTEQQRRGKALETMEVYAPIAGKLGMSGLQQELEDLSLKCLDPIAYAEILERMGQKADTQHPIQEIARKVRLRLEQSKISHADVCVPAKSIYSIYRRMFVQNHSLDEIWDSCALRIILNTIPEYYTALEIVHALCHPQPGHIKGYLSIPRQSPRASVMHCEGIAFALQIRTREMDQLAEYGVAAYWKFNVDRQGGDKAKGFSDWVNKLLENQRDAEDGGDLRRDIKGELIPKEVRVLTPKEDVIHLPGGATVIDFAYAVHSAVGNRMTGAKVNGRRVPVTYRVRTGEVVEVLTEGESSGPCRSWLELAVTGTARSKIRHWLKRERREENILLGKAMLERELHLSQIAIPPDQYDACMENTAARSKMSSTEDLYAAIGYGGVHTSRLLPKIKEEYARLLMNGASDNDRL